MQTITLTSNRTALAHNLRKKREKESRGLAPVSSVNEDGIDVCAIGGKNVNLRAWM